MKAIKGGDGSPTPERWAGDVTCENREKAAANQCRFALWIFLLKLTTARGNCLQLSCDVQSNLGLKRKARWGRADGPWSFAVPIPSPRMSKLSGDGEGASTQLADDGW